MIHDVSRKLSLTSGSCVINNLLTTDSFGYNLSNRLSFKVSISDSLQKKR